VIEFLEAFEWKTQTMHKIVRLCDRYHFVEKKFHHQVVFNRFRLKYLLNLWKEEVLEYSLNLKAAIKTGRKESHALLY
jgi:hypothetical protein